MSIPAIAYAGVTSTDPDFIVAVSPKQQILADSRIVRWYAARDADVDMSTGDTTKIIDFKDRKAVGNATTLSTDATRPTLATQSGLGGKKAALFTAGSDRSASIAGLDLTGSALFIAVLAAKGAVATGVTESIFGCASGSTGVTINGITSSSAGNASLFQFFHGAASSGINVPTGIAGLESNYHLFFGAWDGTNMKGAFGRGATTSGVGSGSPPAAGTTAYIGKSGSGGTPNYLAGGVAQVIIGNVDILASGNADLRELICEYVEQYYGLTV